MATIRRFEDIKAWQSARKLTAMAYRVSRQGEFARDFGLRDQFTRASVSIMNNIAEGFGRRNNKEFALFLEIGKGSACEFQSMTYVALDNGYIDEPTQVELYKTVDETTAMIAAFANYLRTSERSRR